MAFSEVFSTKAYYLERLKVKDFWVRDPWFDIYVFERALSPLLYWLPMKRWLRNGMTENFLTGMLSDNQTKSNQ